MDSHKVLFYGADWCPDCKRAKAFLEENKVDFEFIDIETNEDAVAKLEEVNNGKRVIPTLFILGKSYSNPDNVQLSCRLGLNEKHRVILYGADWCPDCRRAKAYLEENDIHYMFVEVDKFDWATEKVEQINNGKRIIPTLLINGKPFTNPSNAELKTALEISDAETTKVYDTIIVGGGAAGLTTAIYTQRENYSTLILEKKSVGGNAALTGKIENYPGFTEISGPDLMKRMEDQARFFGVQIKEGVEVQSISKEGDIFHLQTNMGEFKSDSVVLTVGSTYRKLGIPAEEELIGAGVHFCATCDGPFYRNREVVVIGGGNSALEESIALSQFTNKVTIVQNMPEFSGTKTYIDKLPTIPNIETRMNKTAEAFLADEKGMFKALRIRDNATGEVEEIQADGAFIFIGLVPNTWFLKGLVELDERGFVVTEPGTVATSVPGIFVAGDTRKGAVAQVAFATGEGVLASFGVKEYLKSRFS